MAHSIHGNMRDVTVPVLSLVHYCSPSRSFLHIHIYAYLSGKHCEVKLLITYCDSFNEGTVTERRIIRLSAERQERTHSLSLSIVSQHRVAPWAPVSVVGLQGEKSQEKRKHGALILRQRVPEPQS